MLESGLNDLAHAPLLLDVRELTKHYAHRHGGTIHALESVSFTLARGESIGVVGESGCGKSTLGRALLRLVEPTSGSVLFEGEDLLALSRRELTRRRRDFQIVFQDPFASLNPRHKIATIVGEPLRIHGLPNVRDRVAELLAMVGLDAACGERFPHEFSGGQRQRIAIARALALQPRLLVADEPVSSLDVSIQSGIINLIAGLRAQLGLSMIFISHDLSVIRHVADRIAVMYFGRIVEIGSTSEVFERPAHPYTRALLSAVPRPGAGRARDRILLQGELPDPAQPPPGCAFQGRCAQALARCARERPLLAPRAMDPGRRTLACHLLEPA